MRWRTGPAVTCPTCSHWCPLSANFDLPKFCSLWAIPAEGDSILCHWLLQNGKVQHQTSDVRTQLELESQSEVMVFWKASVHRPTTGKVFPLCALVIYLWKGVNACFLLDFHSVDIRSLVHGLYVTVWAYSSKHNRDSGLGEALTNCSNTNRRKSFSSRLPRGDWGQTFSEGRHKPITSFCGD